MRVLFTLQPSYGHWHPLVPLARALEDAGHELACACAPTFRDVVEGAGLRFFPLDVLETEAEIAAYDAAAEHVPRHARTDHHFATKYVGRARRALAGLTSIVRDWSPRLVVHENTELAAAIVSERAGVAHAMLQITPVWESLMSVLDEPIARMRSEVGLAPASAAQTLHRGVLLFPRPPSLWDPAVPVPATRVCFRNEDFGGSGAEELPSWASDLGARPLVYASLGSYFGRTLHVLDAIVAGLRGEPIELVLTLGRDGDPARFGALPPHVHVERYIPQDQLLPRCALVVCHGGSGTIMGALQCGAPMVILPISAEQPHNARCCEAAGVARVVDPEETTDLARAIRDAAREVLAKPRYREAAQQIQRELGALPSVRETAVRLSDYASRP